MSQGIKSLMEEKGTQVEGMSGFFNKTTVAHMECVANSLLSIVLHTFLEVTQLQGWIDEDSLGFLVKYAP